jgi:hypothetical protein
MRRWLFFTLETVMKKNTGGSAFPLFAATGYAGMTLRQYIAINAMQGMLSSPNCPKLVDEKELARQCYAAADAMLKAGEE